MEGMAMVPKLLHIYSNAGTAILPPFYPYASLLMPTMWNSSWKKNPISGCDCVIPHIYGQTIL